ncbi:MAG: hypothetical protein HQ463_03465 [Bacteroidetes bacterium]|nr:hypothetical protein [Bacteroidota bacterium]
MKTKITKVVQLFKPNITNTFFSNNLLLYPIPAQEVINIKNTTNLRRFGLPLYNL